MPLLCPSKPVFPHSETLAWKTQILTGASGMPQRVGFRKIPRQIVEYSHPFFNEGEVAALDAMMHYNGKRIWYVPLWAQQVDHGQSLAAGATSIVLDTTAGEWLATAPGNYAVIWQSAAWHEVVTVSAVASGSLTVSALANSYSGHKVIAPCRTGYLTGQAQKRQWPSGAAVLAASYEIVDNQYVSGHVASSTYDNKEVIVAPAGMPSGIYQQSIDPNFTEVDTSTGRRVPVSETEFNRSVQSHLIFCRTAAEAWSLRKWLHALNGPQKSFLVPTFRDDLTLVTACGAADTTITVVNRGVADYQGYNFLRGYAAFRPAGQDLIVRRIDAVAELSAAQERLTLDAAPGRAFLPGESLSWVDCCAIAQDNVTLEWLMPGQCRANLSVERVVNDWPVLDWGVFGSGVMAG